MLLLSRVPQNIYSSIYDTSLSPPEKKEEFLAFHITRVHVRVVDVNEVQVKVGVDLYGYTKYFAYCRI